MFLLKQYNAKKILNIALAGHGGCGKTSVAESMIYLAKASEMPIIRPTQRRAVVTLKKNQCVVLFCSLTIYQTICVGTC